jgi:ketosteroid isomerase-like protein
MPSRLPLLLAGAAGAATAAAAPAAYTATARAILRRNQAALMAGDPGPLVAMYADDATLEFPGEHSWGPVYRGRAEIEGFLRRFLACGLRGELGHIFVDGPPWATRLAVHFDDHADHPETGQRIYENQAVIVLRTRWGRVVHERVYEDTQKVAAFDEALAAA